MNDGIDAWLDKEKLIPGQNWQTEIPKAVRSSDIVIVCLSAKSVNKEGFVQKEIRVALDAADEKPEGTIFIIPVRLENCNVPERISQFQWVDLFADNGYSWLIKALRVRADTVGAVFKPTLEPADVITGVFYHKTGDSEFSVLRFFDDGKVISVSLGDTTDLYMTWSNIKRWFHHDYNSSTGSYRLRGNRITFSTTSSEGTVDYTGKYIDDKLILSTYSHINGYRAKDRVYMRLEYK
jgi:hypothetical protein